MRHAICAALVLTAAGCGATRVGDACKQDADCGSGFDCYSSQCARVCTRDAQCDGGSTCQRYRCLDASGSVPGGPPPTASRSGETPQGAAATSATPPVHLDATAVELRAIRRELEIVRAQQQQILELLARRPEGVSASSPKPTASNAPSASAPTAPTAPKASGTSTTPAIPKPAP